MKMKKLYKWGVSLLLAVTMLALPIGAAIFNGGNSLTVMASDGVESVTEESTEAITDTEESTESGDVSGNEIPEKKCICTEKCSTYEVNMECPVCSVDSSQCAYIAPNVKISIGTPSGWYKDGASVTIQVEDTKNTGNLKIKTVEARISQNGSWTDITDDMSIDISENCSVYVQVTNQNGKTYNKNKYVECFDKVKPTLNAAINDGLLSIQGIDNDSGIKAIYVNGYEFKELTNGVLNIRLQQFDAGYQYFTLQAVDNAGNMSEVYKTSNPYYEDPEVEKDSSDTSKSPASQLPVSATATEPTDAKATVTEHTTDTGTAGNSSSLNQSATDSTTANDTAETEEKGKEFYTITTKSDKVFYLVIDKDQTENNVYLLTEVGENDLLNFTESDTDTLPQNSAVTESALPSGKTDMDKTSVDIEKSTEENTEQSTEAKDKVKEPEKSSNTGTYLIMAIAVFGVGVVIYYMKFGKGKKSSFEEDEYEDDEEENEPEYETEEQEETAPEEPEDAPKNEPENGEFSDDEEDYM